jgi:hypothetical protein
VATATAAAATTTAFAAAAAAPLTAATLAAAPAATTFTATTTAAAAVLGKLNARRKLRESFLVEDVERGEADVGDLLLAEDVVTRDALLRG